MKPGKSQSGFILAATLWILAAITLASALFAVWVHQSVELARQGQEDWQGAIDVNSTRAVLFYLLTTQRITLGGLTLPGEESGLDFSKLDQSTVDVLTAYIQPVGNEIRLDDRVYTGLGKACFSIQDEAGLLNLGSLQTQRLETLLGLMGVPFEKRDPLIDKLLDYTDEDDLYRLNGAEASDYQELGLPPPPNRPLFTSWEIKNVLGWRDMPELWTEHNLPRLTTIHGGTLNLNTAPELILKTVRGIDEEGAGRLVQARQGASFSRIQDVFVVAGKSFSYDPMQISLMSSFCLRLSVWHKEAQHMREIHVILRPEKKEKPWQVDYEFTISLPQELSRAPIQTTSLSFFTSPVSSRAQ